MAITLFPDQEEALQGVMEVYQACPIGGRALVVAPTAWGKTIFFSSLINSLQGDLRGKPVLIIAHRDELLDQAREKIWMIDSTAIVGKVGGGSHDYGAPITVASIDTISGARHLKTLPAFGYGLVIADECFPAGTLIDGKPIEQVQAGDTVTAFDEKDGTFAQKKVVQTFRRPVGSRLLKITSGQHNVVCTPNHPFYTLSGWKKADDLIEGEELLHDRSSNTVRTVRQGIYADQKMAGGQLAKTDECLLFQRMQQNSMLSKIITHDGSNEQEICICPDESQQPNVQPSLQSKGTCNNHRNWALTTDQGREWQRANSATANASRCTGMEAIGICGQNRSTTCEESQSLSNVLQDRYCFPLDENSNRGRRWISPDASQESTGHQENTISYWARVDRIEIYEPGSDGTFGGLCPDGCVYNFEVEDYHTYTANGFVVHNCHHAPAPKYQKVFNALHDVFKLGVTATPDRLDGLSLEPIFGKPVFHMTIQEAVKLGRLSNVKAIAIRTETNLSEIKSKKNMDGEMDFNQVDLDLAVNTPERNRRVVDAYQEHCPDQRGIVFAVSIAHAQALAYAFNDAGIRAVCVIGSTPLEERKKIYAQFEAGEIKILTNVMVLTEGFDAPGIECVIMARPTQSRGLYTQCVGRGLRLAPGKTICTILDLTDNCIKHKLQAPQHLGKAIGIDIKDEESLLNAMEREEEEKELREREARIRKLKSRRPRDIIVNLLDAPLEWTELPNGIFVIEIGDEKHRVAICPSKSAPGLWHVDAKLAPSFVGQRWMENRPFDMCQSHAEIKIHQLLNGEEHLVDKNASWRSKPMDPNGPQAKKLKFHKITYREGLTKGEASDMIDNHLSQIAATKAVKAEKKRQREAVSA